MIEDLRLGVAAPFNVGDLVALDICEVSRFFDREIEDIEDTEDIPEIRIRYAVRIPRQFYCLVRCVKQL